MATFAKAPQQALDLISAPSRRRPLYLVALVCLIAGALWISSPSSSSATSRAPRRPLPPHSVPPATPAGEGGAANGSAWDFRRDWLNYRLTDEQCDGAFPGLFEELERSKADRGKRQITLAEIDSIPKVNGYVRAMIYEQQVSLPFTHYTSTTTLTDRAYMQLYVIATEGGIYSRQWAVLLALHRALVASPDPLPNIEFAFSSDDKLAPAALWAFAKEPADTKTWLMPDFGFWAWPETRVGAYAEVFRKAVAMEDGADNPTGRAWPWEKKVPQVLWRGATMGLEVRERLVKVTAGKPWADVMALDWHDEKTRGQALKSMAEHCQYRYLAHTEGNSYSGRLKYLQNCRSVVVAHPLEWRQHFSPLLDAGPGPGQNYVEVKRDFADLEATIAQLERDPGRARRIADNSVRVFRERYLSPAAEACYWRRLVRTWAELSFEPEFYKTSAKGKEWRGVPFESWILERRLEWDPY